MDYSCSYHHFIKLVLYDSLTNVYPILSQESVDVSRVHSLIMLLEHSFIISILYRVTFTIARKIIHQITY